MAMVAAGVSAAGLVVGCAAGDGAGRGAVVEALNRVVAGGAVPGAQVVVGAGGSVWSAQAGVGDIERGTPFPEGARVRIGSNTKTFVATVMLQLAGEGAVELDAGVERYLPGVVWGPGIDGDRITVRNLLQHTSGLPEYAAEFGATPGPGQIAVQSAELRWMTVDMAEVVRQALTAPAEFEPGAGWAYSNTNYAIAGMVIEKITGNSLGAEITRRIIEPLGLRDTYYPDPGETGIRGPHPVGYLETDGVRVDYTEQNVSVAGAAGAMVSTGADLNRFFTALLNGELLAPAQLAEMKQTVPVPGAGESLDYGLGLMRSSLSCGKDSWGHGGDIDGFEVRGGVTDDGRAVTVTINQVPTTAEPTTRVLEVVDAALCATD